MDDEHLIPARLLVPEWLQDNPKTEKSSESNKDNRKTTKYDGVAFNAMIAVDQILIANLLKQKIFSEYDKASEHLYSKRNDGFFSTFNDRLRKSKITFEKGKISYLTSTSETRHAFFRINEKPINKNIAIKCMEEFLYLINLITNNLSRYLNQSKPSEIFNIDITKYLQIEQLSNNSHETLSKSGAVCFSLGFEEYKKEASHSKKYRDSHKILFIDDEGTNSAWYASLQEFFKLNGCNLEISKLYDKNIKLDSYSLILLDLVFDGDHKKGLEYLKAIKKDNLSIPVVIITADNSAYYARRCMFYGADDYFVKATADKEKEYFDSFNKMVDFCIAQIENTQRIKLWNIINKIECMNWWLDDEKIEKMSDLKGTKGFAKEKFKKLETELMTFPVKEGYFYYLLEINKDKFLDQWRLNRLFPIDKAYTSDIYLCLGQFIEYLMLTLALVQGSYEPEGKAGSLITELAYPKECKSVFQRIWQLRVNAKMGKNIKYQIPKAFEELNGVLSPFLHHVKNVKVNKLVTSSIKKERIPSKKEATKDTPLELEGKIDSLDTKNGTGTIFASINGTKTYVQFNQKDVEHCAQLSKKDCVKIFLHKKELYSNFPKAFAVRKITK